MLDRISAVLVHSRTAGGYAYEVASVKNYLSANYYDVGIVNAVDSSVCGPTAVLDRKLEHSLSGAGGEGIFTEINYESSTEVRKVIEAILGYCNVISSENYLSLSVLRIHSDKKPSCHLKRTVNVAEILYAFRKIVCPERICTLEYTILEYNEGICLCIGILSRYDTVLCDSGVFNEIINRVGSANCTGTAECHSFSFLVYRAYHCKL